MSPRWFLAIFIAGAAVGLLLGRITAGTPFGDFLTGLSFLLLGLGLAVALIAIGWIAGQSQRKADSRASLSATPDDISPSAPSVADVPAVSVPTAAQPTQRVVVGGGRLAILSGNGKWQVRARNLLGYELLQITIALDNRWPSWMNLAEGRQQAAGRGRAWLRRSESFPLLLFVGALLVYALTRLYGLDRFPINFFADEAIQVTNAVDLVKRGLRDPQGGFLPMYFNVFFFVNPDIAVYFHAVTASLFGKSIVVARATSALLTLIAAGALGLAMKEVFQARSWWAIVLLLTITPVWFLHSRTAFDAVAMASLYALFIVAYLYYRYRSPRYLYLALILAAATFYAYPSGQVAIGLLALFLLLFDIRYHLQNRRTVLWAVPLVVLLAIPFIRFELVHPGEANYHLSQVNSYWLQNIPLSDKLAHFVDTYARLLSPGYWFLPNELDLIRHRMKDYGLLPLVELPLLLVGLVLTLRRFGESRYRTLLVALLAAPVGGALVDIGILRTMAFVIPVALVSAVGLEWIFERVRSARAAAMASLAVFGVLSVMGLWMMQDALTNGPTWFSDYTLYGMQWGARQVFEDELPRVAAENPDAPIYVSDTWANGSDIFVRFFGLDPVHVQMMGINAWLEKKLPLADNAIFIMTPDEFAQASESKKLQNIRVLSTIPYPDGRAGFYITRAEYADNADAIFEQEREALRQPVTESVVIDGQTVQVAHTKFDIGDLQAIFDGDPRSVARGVEANPLILDLQFPEPRKIQKLSGYFGRANIHLTVHAYGPDGSEPVRYDSEYDYLNIATEQPAGQVAEMALETGPDQVSRLHIEIQYMQSDETAHVHIFDLRFQ